MSPLILAILGEKQASGDAEMSETIVVSAYCAISSVFMLMTALEGWAVRGGWTLARGFGLAACPLWPLLLAAFILHTLLAPRRLPRLTRAA